MVDAQTTSRWYFIVTMGRKAGHLALGIGKATGATLTLVPEEFPGDTISLNHVVDVLVGSIIKRLSYGKSDGVAILAEGIVERLKIEDLDQLVDIERDAHDNIRIAEVNFGEILKTKVQQKLKEYGLKITVVAKNIGYELRCADPIPFDMEYTRDLGFSASQFILDGGSGAMISIQNGRFVPLYFKDILDPATKRTRVRMVDPSSESFYIARKYMLRLNKSDFEDPHELAKLAATAHLSIEEFKKRFSYLIEQDMMYKHLENGTISFLTADSNVAFKARSAPRENGDAVD
jgi:6-phosphofructokinase 1